MNICVELERRQWLPVEGWNWRLLYAHCEERALQRMRKRPTFHEVVRGGHSTMAIAFSCDGQFMASGHLTHEIVVCHMTPWMRPFQTLSGHHTRTPWCLTFDPRVCHTLYSGCLGGVVCKWNVQTGMCLLTWNSGTPSPVNSIVFPPWTPHHALVAVDKRLYLLSVDSLSVVWHSDTGSPNCKVRLVLHHPEDDRILTAITNPPRDEIPFMHSLRTVFSSRTTYRLQVYRFGMDQRPDLENASQGLLCLSARIYGSHSCVLTTDCVACTNIHNTGRMQLSIYSILPRSFGQCLYAVPLDLMGNVVSLSLSSSGSYLLLGIAAKKDIFHMNRQHASGPVAQILQLKPSNKKLRLEPLCTLTSPGPFPLSSNVALWAPLEMCGGVMVGTARGGVVYWGSDLSNGRREENKPELIPEWHDAS